MLTTTGLGQIAPGWYFKDHSGHLQQTQVLDQNLTQGIHSIFLYAFEVLYFHSKPVFIIAIA